VADIQVLDDAVHIHANTQEKATLARLQLEIGAFLKFKNSRRVPTYKLLRISIAT